MSSNDGGYSAVPTQQSILTDETQIERGPQQNERFEKVDTLETLDEYQVKTAMEHVHKRHPL